VRRKIEVPGSVSSTSIRVTLRDASSGDTGKQASCVDRGPRVHGQNIKSTSVQVVHPFVHVMHPPKHDRQSHLTESGVSVSPDSVGWPPSPVVASPLDSFDVESSTVGTAPLHPTRAASIKPSMVLEFTMLTSSSPYREQHVCQAVRLGNAAKTGPNAYSTPHLLMRVSSRPRPRSAVWRTAP
jgi:hypothetical protein